MLTTRSEEASNTKANAAVTATARKTEIVKPKSANIVRTGISSHNVTCPTQLSADGHEWTGCLEAKEATMLLPTPSVR